MRALLTAVRCEKGDVDGNLARHLALVDAAAADGCDLVLFPEMSLTGSARAALRVDAAAVRTLAAATAASGVAAVFGLIEDASGALFITQVVAAGGVVVAAQRKRHLGEGEEMFTASADRTPAVAVLAGVPTGVAICAEADAEYPFADAAGAGARLLCFAAAPGLHGRRVTESDWRAGFEWWRGHCLERLPARAQATGCPILVSTQAGATVDEDFPGWAALFDASGAIVAERSDWSEGSLVVDVC
jgi:predicted amidohydrolase